LPIPADVSRADDVARLVEETVAGLGALDVLVTNTGGPRSAPFESIGDDEWHAAVASLLMSVVRLSRAAVPHMRARGGGRIVNITSAVNFEAVAGLSAYGAAKGAIASLTKALALELAPAGITVNAVAPGATDTSMNADAYTDEVRRNYEQRIPLGRIGTSEEIADVVVFLASDGARYITGQELLVDGGLTINGSVGHAPD
jgi:NAD(P)-dependent dehydrogenase (short-subunit alcohol dehydrogenase family)